MRIAEGELQRHIDIGNLPEWCASVTQVLREQGSRGVVITPWGEAMIHRELINGGVRFSCPNSPYAMQWTVTVAPDRPSEVLLHMTANREIGEIAEREQLEIFLADWRAGLEEWPLRRAAKMNKPCVQCADSFGGFG